VSLNFTDVDGVSAYLGDAGYGAFRVTVAIPPDAAVGDGVIIATQKAYDYVHHRCISNALRDQATFTVTGDTNSRTLLSGLYGRLPLSFQPNLGQTDPEVRFLSNTNRYALFLTSTMAVFAFRDSRPASRATSPRRLPPLPERPARSDVLRMSLLGADQATELLGQHKLSGRTNYFIGRDPSAWITTVPQYADVTYRSIYPGVDLTYHGGPGGRLEYDFFLGPHADPASIKLGFQGQTGIALDADGALTISLPEGVVRQPQPLIYQQIGGSRRFVSGGYVTVGARQVGFVVGSYDHDRPLVIDPEISYSTYLGGSDFDVPAYSALDRFGNFYLAGFTSSIAFPTTAGAFQPVAPGGDGDAFVTKINRDGTALVYSTYLGGGDYDFAIGIDVDRSGNAYVTGETTSTDFPTTQGAFQPSNAGGLDAFVTKLEPSGSALEYSTYFGGTGDDSAFIGPVDRGGRVYAQGLTGSKDFPVTDDAFQRSFAGGDGTLCGFPCDAFVARLDNEGSGLDYSTYLGGSGDDLAADGAVDRFGQAHTTGITDSSDFPATPGAFQTSYGGGNYDGFVVDVNRQGTDLLFATYLGGSGSDGVLDLTVDHRGNTYVPGYTDSSDFPTTQGALQQSIARGLDGYLAKLSANGSDLVYSTLLGGSGDDLAGAVRVDRSGVAYVPGQTSSTDFPITNDAIQPSFAGGDGTLCGSPCDAFLLTLNPNASQILFSTYLGGSGDDVSAGEGLGLGRSGDAYVPGFTSSVDFPVTKGTFETTFGGVADGFAMKIGFDDENVRASMAPRPPATPARPSNSSGFPDNCLFPWRTACLR
jgi:hypothetical protein